MESDPIQAVKQPRAKPQPAPPQPPVQQPVQPVEQVQQPQPAPAIVIPKKKKTLSEAQKATLERGRANLKAKKEQQLKVTEEYKESLILLKAEQLKQQKKNMKKSVGLPAVSDDEEEVIEVKPKKKKPRKLIYVSESESEEEEVVYKSKPKSNKVPPTPPNTPANNGPRMGGITFY